jgi:hypothetical protein
VIHGSPSAASGASNRDSYRGAALQINGHDHSNRVPSIDRDGEAPSFAVAGPITRLLRPLERGACGAPSSGSISGVGDPESTRGEKLCRRIVRGREAAGLPNISDGFRSRGEGMPRPRLLPFASIIGHVPSRSPRGRDLAA